MVDGNGDPNTVEEYQEAVVALYSVAYTLKFAIKRGGGLDYTVMPLEGCGGSMTCRPSRIRTSLPGT